MVAPTEQVMRPAVLGRSIDMRVNSGATERLIRQIEWGQPVGIRVDGGTAGASDPAGRAGPARRPTGERGCRLLGDR